MQQKGLNFTPCSMKRYENIFRIFVGLKVGQICEELSAHFCSSATSMKTMRAKIKTVCPIFFFRYVVFYLPFDVGFKVLKFFPIKMVCEALREILR